jgi:hypothetical protein
MPINHGNDWLWEYLKFHWNQLSKKERMKIYHLAKWNLFVSRTENHLMNIFIDFPRIQEIWKKIIMKIDSAYVRYIFFRGLDYKKISEMLKEEGIEI